VILAAVSCSVYDASLLGKGAEPGGGGTSPGAGHSGTAGESSTSAGRSGSAGKPAVNGGASGESSGDGGMMDTAGAPETGGESAEGGTAGRGTAGSGGTAGKGTAGGGTAGGGTSGGGTSGGGTAGGGTAGRGGSGGSAAGSGGASAGAGGSPPATGCAKLYVPIDAGNDQAHFVIGLGSSSDLSSATTGIVSMRVYVQAGAAGTIFNYVQDSQFRFLGVATAMRPDLSSISGWQTLSFNVGGQADTLGSGIAKNNITRVGIEINAAPATTGWSNPTIVYVDSITVGTPGLSFPLATTSTVNTTPMTTDAPNQALFLNSGPGDTTATGVTLSWQATCP
jgi:hypothetical protein